MKKILMLCLAVLAFCTGAQAQKIARLHRYAEANAALPPADGPRVVLFGDSITDGWPGQRPEFFAENGFIGRGIGGEETANMLIRFRADVLDIGATVMVFLGGINDIAQNLGDPYNEDATYSNIVSMIDLCWQNGVRPVICSLLPSYHFRWREEVTDSFEKVYSLNARLKAYCDRHGVTFVDYCSVLAGPDGKILEAYSGDTVHPNAAGYERMEKLLLDTLK